MEKFIWIIITNAIFFGIALMVNKDNAKLLLAGYNTMPNKDQEKFDLINFIPFFRKFFINLSIYSSIIYFGCLYFLNFKKAVIFYFIYLLLSFCYFIIMSNSGKFKKNNT